MKIKTIISVIVLLLTSSLICENISVDVDGTMDFTSIQEAIYAATNGDSIIVYPGIYYENLNLLGKSLSIVSTYIYTENDSLIASTVIDGGASNRCFYIEDSDIAHINGFTIQNGRDHTFEGGGAIYNENSSLNISNCIIENNRANAGGGLFNFESDIILNNNIFRYNRGDYLGGAILHLSALPKLIIFDEVEKNSVYLNYSANGSDLVILPHHEIETITLEIFTVLEPTQFYAAVPEGINFDIEQGIITPIENDVYVSPTGSDDNSGISPSAPFQTIAWAQMNVKSDSLNQYRIILEDGTYSPSLNNQLFPLNIQNYVGIFGSGRESTILDAESLGNFLFYFTNFEKKDIYFKDLTLQNGETPHLYSSCIDISYVHADLYLENCNISNNSGDSEVIKTSEGNHKFINCNFLSNTQHKVLDITPAMLIEEPYITLNIVNCIFDNNQPFIDPEGFHSGGAIRFFGLYTGVGEYHCNIINSQFSRNRNIFNNGNQGGIVGISFSKNLDANIINCTFSDNIIQYPNGTCINVNDGAQLNIYSSLFFGNDYNTISLRSEDCTVNIHNSLLEGGEDNIYYGESGTVNWYGESLFDDPFFIESGINVYHLLSNSPCIDTGTMDLPNDIELPEFDLAGNPRVYGEGIDMGCYEWQGTDYTNDELPIKTYELSNFPNPFNPETILEFSISEDTEVLLSIYNIRGQLVRTLINSKIEKGQHRIIWDGKNESGQSVTSGVYYCKLKGKKQESINKMILIK